jgi:hypothetical protein
VLLRPDDAARPHDAQPAYGLVGGEAPACHQPQGDEGAGATEAGAAVDGDRAGDLVTDGEEAGDGGWAGGCAVIEVEVDVPGKCVDENLCLKKFKNTHDLKKAHANPIALKCTVAQLPCFLPIFLPPSFPHSPTPYIPILTHALLFLRNFLKRQQKE